MENLKWDEAGMLLYLDETIVQYMKDVYVLVIDKIFDEQSETNFDNGVVEKTLDLYHRQIEFTSCEKDEKLFTEFTHYKKCRRLWRRYQLHLNLF